MRPTSIERIIPSFLFEEKVPNHIFGTDDSGKVTVVLRLTNPQGAITALDNDKERFLNAGLGREHVEELGESGANNVADFRSYTEAKNRLGPKSLQINIGKTSGRARADLDRTNPKQDVVGGVVHGGEYIYHKFRNIFKKKP